MIENHEITLNGKEYRVDIDQDWDIREPWNEFDFHGIVSDWTHRAKAPGEIVLCEDRGAKRFYDFAETCKIARKDWGFSNRKEAAQAAYRDFENLRAFLDDVWTYAFVTLTEIRTDHDGIEYDGFSDSIGGVEYWQAYAYHDEKNKHIRDEIIPSLESEILAQHKDAA